MINVLLITLTTLFQPHRFAMNNKARNQDPITQSIKTLSGIWNCNRNKLTLWNKYDSQVRCLIYYFSLPVNYFSLPV